MLRSRSGRASTARRSVSSVRLTGTSSSISGACVAINSPSPVSLSLPTGLSRLATARAARRTSRTCFSGSFAAFASSSSGRARSTFSVSSRPGSCGRRQQWIAPRLVQEELERVGRRDGEVAVHVRGVGPAADPAVVGQRDPALVELLVQRLELFALELEFLGQLGERREVD